MRSLLSRVALPLALLALHLLVQVARAQDCTLLVPPLPLTATGLATPYVLTSTNNDGTCTQELAPSFVQGAIIDLVSGQISVYNPLIIDQGTTAAIAPTLPKLPAAYVAALWFGSNANVLRLKANAALVTDNSDPLEQGSCVNGGGTLEHSVFGQFAHCNAPAFFSAARRVIAAGLLTVPALGTARDGLACPTTRDFSVVDMDPSDNVLTTYLISSKKTQAQDTPANRAAMKKAGFTVIDNGSDNRLLTAFIYPAIGCTGWFVPDLADTTGVQKLNALPLNELQASLYQQAPIAYVPAGDDMVVTAAGMPDVAKLNAYRLGVGQFEVGSVMDASASTMVYCRGMYSVGAPRIFAERSYTQGGPTVDPAVGTNLYSFLVGRFNMAVGPTGLNCVQLLGLNSPFAGAIVDANGVVLNSTIDNNMVTAAANKAIPDAIPTPAWQVNLALNPSDISKAATGTTGSGSNTPGASGADDSSSGAGNSTAAAGTTGAGANTAGAAAPSSGSSSSGGFTFQAASFGVGLACLFPLLGLYALFYWCRARRYKQTAMMRFAAANQAATETRQYGAMGQQV